MAYEQKPNTGTLWPNNNKKEDRHPDEKGPALICCPNCQQTTLFEVAGWWKQAKTAFLSLSFKVKDQRGEANNPPPRPPGRGNPAAPVVKTHNPVPELDTQHEGDDVVPF